MTTGVDEGSTPVGKRGVDPFGATVGERIWRRLAGAGVAVVAACAFVWWTTEVLPWVLLGALVVYVLGIPASWFVARGGGTPVLAHAVAAFVLVAVLALGIIVLWPVSAWWVVPAAVIAVAVGVPAAMLAASAGTRLPARWVRPVAVLGLVVTVVGLPAGWWLAQRPPAPYDFVVVHEPDLVRQGNAYDFAETLAGRFERRAAAGQSRTAHATWVAVGDGLSTGTLSGVANWQRLTPDEDLPTLKGSGQPVRLITTIFDGETTRGCVVLAPDRSWAEPQACADLDLAD